MGLRLLARQDREPLYRLAISGGDLYTNGYESKNELYPSSLQSHQNRDSLNNQISTTRDDRPIRERVDRLYAVLDALPANHPQKNHQVVFSEIWIAGGIDVMASMNRAAAPDEQEVTIQDEIPGENITRAWTVTRDYQLLPWQRNTNAYAAMNVMAERERSNTDFLRNAEPSRRHPQYQSQSVSSGANVTSSGWPIGGQQAGAPSNQTYTGNQYGYGPGPGQYGPGPGQYGPGPGQYGSGQGR